MTLRDLDDRLVPRLALALRRLLDAAGRDRAAGVQALARWWAGVLAPPPPGERGPLRRLDDRYASSGPLALVRDVPQIGLLVVGGVLLAGTGAAIALSGPASDAPARQGPAPAMLGPTPGTVVDDHVAAARARLETLSRDAPDQVRLALVELDDHLEAADVGALVPEAQVRRVYLEAPLAEGATAELIPVEVPPGALDLTLVQVYARTAERKAQEQRELQALASAAGPDGADPETAAELEQLAEVAGLEADAYAAGCACVMALVVEAPVRDLVEVAALGPVRAVEVAERGADLPAVDVRPLPPEVSGVVPEPVRREVPQR